MPVEPDTIKKLFVEATEKATPAERAAFLDEACAGDAALRRRVEALLLAHDQPHRLLDQPAVEHLGDCPPTEPGAEGEALAFLAPPQNPGSLGRLGHYEVFKVIGRGGMGIVLQAFDEKLQRVVAIKVLAPHLATSGPARQRFVREARAAAAVTHDNVIAIYAVEDDGPVPYLVMQCVEGKTLQEKLNRDGPLHLTEILRIGLQVADGLAAAHRHGLVHRDVKPANILLENAIEWVRITDFGLARAVDDANLTQSGVCAGTPMYMSPEQASGVRADQRSDLFSLGSVLYAMCCGHPPFRAETTMGVLKRVCEDTPRPLREQNPAVPDWLAAVIARLMAKAPAERFQTATEVATLLGEHLARLQGQGTAPHGVAARPAEVSVRRQPRAWKRAATAAVGLIVFGVVVVLWLKGPQDRPGPVGGPQEPPGSASRPNPTQLLPDPVELASRPAAADALDPKDIPVDLLKAAGGGDPKNAPPELVAILGEDRHQGRADQPCHLYAVAISPDGKTLASGGTDKVVRLWDLATGKVRRELTGHQQPDVYTIFTLAFSPDGTILASGDREGGIMFWEVATGRDLRRVSAPGDTLLQIAFSPDGALLAAARKSGVVQLWNVPAGTLHATLGGGKPAWSSVAFSPDGRTLAAGESLEAHLWDVATGTKTASLPTHTASFRWMAFHPDGRSLATAATYPGLDLTVRVWDAATLRETRRLEGHTSDVLTGAWRADGQLLATGGATDGTVRLWDLTTDPPRCKVLSVIPPNLKWLHVLAFSPEGRHLAVSHPAGMVYVLRLAKRGEVFRVPPGP